MISFLLDMGVSPICKSWLTENGFNAIHLIELNLSQISDAGIILLAQNENKIILTCDNDFGSLMALGKYEKPSVILFRLEDFTPTNICKKLSIILKEIQHTQFIEGIFITVKEQKYRVRKLPMIT